MSSDGDGDGLGGVDSDFGTGMEPMEEDVGDPTGGSSSTSGSESTSSSTVEADGSSTLKERREGVKDERPETVTVYLQEGTKADITMVKARAQQEFPGESISDLDLYEAIFQAGLENEEAVLDELREIGYGKHGD